MRFGSVLFLCVLAGCSWRSEQKLTYVPFAAQMKMPAVSQQTGNVGGATCPCQCAVGTTQGTPYSPVSNASLQPTYQQVLQPVLQQAVPQQSTSSPDYLLPKEDVYPSQPTLLEAPVQASDQIVILQHPVQRDLVKCSFADLRCISGYELQGYVQLSRTPSVPVSVEQQYDVLDGKWSDSSSVPRW